HPRHPFASQGEASIQEVAQEPLILYDHGSSFFALIDQVCRESGIMPRVEINLDSLEATKHLVKLGVGISFLPRKSILQELDNRTLTAIPLTEGHQVIVSSSVIVRRAQHQDSAVLAFLEVVR